MKPNLIYPIFTTMDSDCTKITQSTVLCQSRIMQIIYKKVEEMRSSQNYSKLV